MPDQSESQREIGKHSVLLNVDVTMSKDTRQRIFRRNSERRCSKEKGRVCTRPAGTFSQHWVSSRKTVPNYGCNYSCGVLRLGAAGVVVAGLAVGAAGLVAAGFGAGAGTPDCAL